MFSSDLNTGRGVIIYTLENLCVTNLELDTQFQESVWCKIKLKKADNLLLGCIYLVHTVRRIIAKKYSK